MKKVEIFRSSISVEKRFFTLFSLLYQNYGKDNKKEFSIIRDINQINYIKKWCDIEVWSLFAGHVSNVAVALTLSVIVLMIFVICFSFCAARQYNKKFQYETPHKALIDNMIIIPMDNICSPLIASNNASDDNNTTDGNTANHDLNDDNTDHISEENI